MQNCSQTIVKHLPTPRKRIPLLQKTVENGTNASQHLKSSARPQPLPSAGGAAARGHGRAGVTELALTVALSGSRYRRGNLFIFAVNVLAIQFWLLAVYLSFLLFVVYLHEF